MTAVPVFFSEAAVGGTTDGMQSRASKQTELIGGKQVKVNVETACMLGACVAVKEEQLGGRGPALHTTVLILLRSHQRNSRLTYDTVSEQDSVGSSRQ
jgi:hypothetical protein